MKLLLILCTTLAMTGAANAACVGTGTYKSCTDASGNHYTVNKFGNQTVVNGSNSNTGNTWSQTSTHLGNTTITNGRAADGDRLVDSPRRRRGRELRSRRGRNERDCDQGGEERARESHATTSNPWARAGGGG